MKKLKKFLIMYNLTILMTSFEELVDEAYSQLGKEIKKTTLVLPQLEVEVSPTRLHWKNVETLCQVIKRDPDHFISFLKKEMMGKEINWFSGSKADGLIVHGKRQNKQHVSEMALKYISVFVTCPSCKNSNTVLTKEKFECLDCGMNKFM
jgi:translation initiation factor 2 beta subunit (eIF-2beta)/eIF-5